MSPHVRGQETRAQQRVRGQETRAQQRQETRAQLWHTLTVPRTISYSQL